MTHSFPTRRSSVLAFHGFCRALRMQPESDLAPGHDPARHDTIHANVLRPQVAGERTGQAGDRRLGGGVAGHAALPDHPRHRAEIDDRAAAGRRRSEEHTSELQSLMRISYAVFCLKKKTLILYKLSHHNDQD